MKGDFTRSTFNGKKHYSSVRMQQGRVQLDADWNEQADIQRYMRRLNTHDIVGKCGAPLHNAGFALRIDEDNAIKIGKGHFYAHGILCENETEMDFEPEEGQEPQINRNYLFYLDVWEQHITAIEDKSIREIALGGPDTATRTKIEWEVKCLDVIEALQENPCIQDFAKWNVLTAKRIARLKAFAEPEESSSHPCIVPPGAGYTGLENYLYRVEIHEGSQGGGVPTFKWSRENGSIVRAIANIDIDKNIITIVEPGQDVLHAFAPDQWVEVTDDVRELKQQPGTLVLLTSVINGVSLTFDPDPACIIGDPINETNYPDAQNPKVRRWESAEIEISASEIDLEHGLKVQFKLEDDYRSGDYWLIPARTSSGKIEWDETNDGWVERFGIEHHYCRLAVLSLDGSGNWHPIKDCRKLFPPATEIVSLLYVGGDGQEAMPGEPLPSPLEVMVTAGQHPVKDARVQFIINRGSGTLIPGGIIKTEVDGIAKCELRLGGTINENNADLQIEARLLDAVLFDDNGDVINETGNAIHPSIHFNINASIASSVSYNPKCSYLRKREVSTVQAAIDALCEYSDQEPGVHIRAIRKTGPEGETSPLVNDSEISANDLVSGLQIVCDDVIDSKTLRRKPTCFVTLYLPFPFNSADQKIWGNPVIGFQPLVLDAEVNSDNEIIYWNPSKATGSWLQERLFAMMIELKRGQRILSYLTLKGNFIWSEKDPSMYLDGEAFGVPEGKAESNLALPSGNGRRGGDFEMWFWLVEGAGIRYVEYNLPEGLIVRNGLCNNGKKNCEKQGEISGGRFYAMVGNQVAVNGNPDALVGLLVNEGTDKQHVLSGGGALDLPGGFVLAVGSIDVQSRQVWFRLSKDGATIDEFVSKEKQVISYSTNIANEKDVPVFVTYVETIFVGAAADMVRITSTWLISKDA